MNPPSDFPRDATAAAQPAVADRAQLPRSSGQGFLVRATTFCLIIALVLALALAVRHLILVDLGWSGVPARDSAKPGAAANQNAAESSQHRHPLQAALEFAQQVQQHIDSDVHDYTATLIKQERIGGELGPEEICFVKIRNQPFSVYMKFLSPPDLAGQEVIFVAGQNEGKLIGHAGSGLTALLGSKWLPPNGPIAMLGQHYPITELGISNLVRRLNEVGERDMHFGDCHVWRNDNAQVGDRPCICITVEHLEKQHGFIFHIARIFVDKERMVLLRYEAYDWPANPGDPPQLIEQYTYANLKLNPGLTDADFDPNNPDYNFGLQ